MDQQQAGHDCQAEAVEVATYPYRNGAFWTWVECGACGARLAPATLDSVL